jgi:large subunit ribosomal protein L3
MSLGLLGLKVGMTQIYEADGKIAPVTVLQVGPCPILQVKTKGQKKSGDDKNGTGDGYESLQLGFLEKPRRKATRPERGHVSANLESRRRQQRAKAGVQMPPKADVEPQQHIQEFRLDKAGEHKVGEVLTVEGVFKDVKAVDVIALSKGRGTAGAMKRHGFHGLGASHGVKKHHRSPGSVGSLASNRGSGRPKKGKKLPGRMGNAQITVRNLTVVRIDAENHVILVKGGVPGPNGGVVTIRPTNKKKG